MRRIGSSGGSAPSQGSKLESKIRSGSNPRRRNGVVRPGGRGWHTAALVVSTAALTLALTPISFAATGIFGSYLELKVNTASEAWYGAQEWGNDIQNFQGANLGTVNWVTGTLGLTAWQVQTFKSGGGDVTGANMYYRVYQQNATPPSFTSSNAFFIANSPFTGPQGSTASGVGDQNWGRDPIAINLLAGVTGDTTRTFNVEVYFEATTNEGTKFSNNGGSNYIASVTVTPEPEAYAIAATGIMGLGLTAWRKRKRA